MDAFLDALTEGKSRRPYAELSTELRLTTRIVDRYAVSLCWTLVSVNKLAIDCPEWRCYRGAKVPTGSTALLTVKYH